MGTTERACTRRSCSQETRIPPLLHPIYTPQIDKAPQNRRRELLQPYNAANQVPICVRRSETVVSMRKQNIRTHAQTRQKLGTRMWNAQQTDHYPEQGSVSSAKQHLPPPTPTHPARVHRGSPSAACYQRSTEKASQEPRGGRRP